MSTVPGQTPERPQEPQREEPAPPAAAPQGAQDDGLVDPQGRLRRAAIQVRPSPLGGRGVFAAKPLRAGALIEECPVLVSLGYSQDLGDYVIQWGEKDDERQALPLGYGACYNHSSTPNAYWEADEDRAVMIIWAAQDIAADEELLISYGPEWFPDRGLRPAQEQEPAAAPAPAAAGDGGPEPPG